tara:strand:+ start:220 stop:456 length:237 start_codon:yes stop_codon:yes gene_type:complete
MKGIILILLAVTLSACTAKESDQEIQKRGKPIIVESKGRIMGQRHLWNYDTITTVRLEDGTRCAVYFYNGGIDCDWRK